MYTLVAFFVIELFPLLMSWNIRYKFSSAFLMNRLYKIELIDGRSLGFFLSNAATMFRRSYEYLFDMGGYDPLKIFSINVFMHPMEKFYG